MRSLYIHIPFCIRKCHYCGFSSTAYARDRADIFLAGLAREIGLHLPVIRDTEFGSLYIGGGTPTSLAPDQMRRLLSLIAGTIRFSEAAEITVEANPGSLSREHLDLCLNAGVNRLSIGVQSFSSEMLRLLGRLHTAEQACDAIRMARQAGFRNINIDLIYGIPGLDRSLWEQAITQALAFTPEHLSLYSLSLDEGAHFSRMADTGAFLMPDEELIAAQYTEAVERLAGAGLALYELSNFARPGFECRHNSNYWARGEYLGLGPGASTFLEGRRSVSVADPEDYARRLQEGQSIVHSTEVPKADEAAREHLLLGLRTVSGISLLQYRERFGVSAYERLMQNYHTAEGEGLARVANGHLLLSPSGRLLADEAIIRLST